MLVRFRKIAYSPSLVIIHFNDIEEKRIYSHSEKRDVKHHSPITREGNNDQIIGQKLF